MASGPQDPVGYIFYSLKSQSFYNYLSALIFMKMFVRSNLMLVAFTVRYSLVHSCSAKSDESRRNVSYRYLRGTEEVKPLDR